MNKVVLSALGVVLLLGFVVASYVVWTSTVTNDIEEAFDNIGFGIVGDDTYSDWASASSCGDIITWTTINGLVLDPVYPGESREVCISFDNLAQADLPYGMTVTPSCSGMNLGSVSGTAIALSNTVDSASVSIDADAEPQSGCAIDVEFTRG